MAAGSRKAPGHTPFKVLAATWIRASPGREMPEAVHGGG